MIVKNVTIRWFFSHHEPLHVGVLVVLKTQLKIYGTNAKQNLEGLLRLFQHYSRDTFLICIAYKTSLTNLSKTFWTTIEIKAENYKLFGKKPKLLERIIEVDRWKFEMPVHYMIK